MAIGILHCGVCVVWVCVCVCGCVCVVCMGVFVCGVCVGVFVWRVWVCLSVVCVWVCLCVGVFVCLCVGVCGVCVCVPLTVCRLSKEHVSNGNTHTALQFVCLQFVSPCFVDWQLIYWRSSLNEGIWHTMLRKTTTVIWTAVCGFTSYVFRVEIASDKCLIGRTVVTCMCVSLFVSTMWYKPYWSLNKKLYTS
jgi:hypothetical protein